jgi:sulfur relay (sulfurtransferase) DsrC/TusE family protein
MNSSLHIEVETSIPFLEAVFAPYRAIIGDDYQGYRNHVYRMVHFCFALAAKQGMQLSDIDKKKIIIAGVFHDIGIWTEHTLDYIEPSLPPAAAYLTQHQLSDWNEEISLMIANHHKLRAYTQVHSRLVELFRLADLVDFSLGFIRNGLDKSIVKQVKVQLPNAGFHIGLLKKAMPWLVRHPLNPFPMMKW